MRRTERTYYLLTGGYNLAHFFIAPLYPLFLLSRGLDVFRMNVVLATYMITVFVFEVPTGALADVVGRRFAFVTGCLVRAVAYTVYTRAHGFGDCLRAELIDAIGTTFVSGALDAWVVDGMRDAGQRGPMDAVFARGNTIMRGVMMAGAILAGYLADRSLEAPWLVAAALFVAVGIAGGALMRDGARRAEASASVARTAVEGLAIVRRSPVLSLLCGLTLCGASAALPVYMLFPPRLRALGAEHLHVMGWVVAAINVAGLVGSAAVPRLLRRVRRESVLAAASLWRAAMLLPLGGSTRLAPAVGGLVLQELGFGVSDPVTTAWVNEHVEAAQRATVLSVRSTFMTLGASLGLVILGLVAHRFGSPVAFAVSAALFALVAPGYALLGRVVRRSGVTPAAVGVPVG